jgi:thiol-disulfide isomerase/thioredoxin
MDPARARRAGARGVAVIALGLDTGLLTRVSLASTGGIEQKLINAVRPPPRARTGAESRRPLPVEGQMPSLAAPRNGSTAPPLTAESLRGKVVLVDFWTYSCINCLRSLPYVRAWADKYKDQGLVVIGVHAPEFAFEKDRPTCAKAVKDLGVDYPVALDNDYAIWRASTTNTGRRITSSMRRDSVRHHHFRRRRLRESEDVIPATCTWCLARAVTASRSASASPSTAKRLAPITAWIPTPTATARHRTAPVPVGAPGQRQRRAAVRNRVSSIPACRRTPSRSADPSSVASKRAIVIHRRRTPTEVAMSRIDETLAMDRRRFLRAALTGGALLVAGGALVIPRLFAADNTTVGKPGNVCWRSLPTTAATSARSWCRSWC